MALSEAASASTLPALTAQTRLLVVAPHPDDETIAAGLLIQQVRAAGGEVRVVLLTRGDNNPWPQRWLERRWRIGAAERQRWGRRRHAEMLQALQCLGLPAQDLRTLDWPDLGVTDALLQPDSRAVSRLAGEIEPFRPNLIVLPALADRHPDHAAAHVLTRLVMARQMARQTPSVPLWTYLVHGRTPVPHEVEIPAVAAQQLNKSAALEAHASQTALSGPRMRRLALRPERYAELLAPESRCGTILPWKPSWWLRPWLRLSVVDQAGTSSWRWRDAPLRRDSQGCFHLSPSMADEAEPYFVRLALSASCCWIFDRWGWCERSG